jgi:hypothetical protein
MDGSTFLDAVGEETATELGRLGSDKYLVAATTADLSTVAVLESVAHTAASGRDTFAAWADGAADPAAGTFADAAEREAAAYDRLADLLADEGADLPEPDPADPVHRALQSADGTVERAGAIAGRGLVCDRTRLQVVNFFVNEGDKRRADIARELRTDATDEADAAATLLERVCEGEGDWDRARGAAVAVVEAAYDDYAERLEAMGVDPKPVC